MGYLGSAQLLWTAALTSLLTACGGDDLNVTLSSDAGIDASVDATTVDAAAVQPCSGDGLSFCTAGRCTLSGMASSLPPGAVVTLTEQPLDPALVADALFPYQCEVLLPAGVDAGRAGFQLEMSAPSGATVASTGATLFEWSSPFARRIASEVIGSGAGVAGTVVSGGIFGVAAAPAMPSITATLGSDGRSSNSQAALLRNVSGGRMDAAFYDGTHLYLGSGARVLIYNEIPTSPSVKPDVVLGQSDLDSTLVGTTAAIFDQSVTAIWSNGQKLVVGMGNRVLVWNEVPTLSFTPADIVLGQPDFSSDKANNGGLSASALTTPWGIDSDGTRLAIADIYNNRVLVWNSFPTAIDQPASSVIGQASFSTSVKQAGQLPIYQAWDVAFAGAGAYVASAYTGALHTADAAVSNADQDYAIIRSLNAVQPDAICIVSSVTVAANGTFAVGDACADRIGVWRTTPTATTPMDFALGQPDTHAAYANPVSASSLSTNIPGARAGNGKFLVHDSQRVLLWDAEPTYAFEPATRVFGQGGFTTNDVGTDYRNLSASTLAYPAAVAVGGGLVAVADRGNNRVLLYSSAATTGAAAKVVVGQPDFTSFVPDLDQVTPSAARLSGPAGVALDGQHLIVADTENHRVLIWNQVPTTSGVPADIVLGQVDFSGRRPNAGRGDLDGDGHSDAAADGFFSPTGVASDGTHLFVADRVNNRILVWEAFPTTSGEAANAVIGQPDVHGVLVNRGSGPDGVQALAFQLPTGLALDGTTLYVADTENNRVVRIENAATAPIATAWIGQADGTSESDSNFYAQTVPSNAGFPFTPNTTASTVLRPTSVTLANGKMYISEAMSNRVHIFDATTLASIGFLGQSDPTSAIPNVGGVSGASVSAPAGLAADGSNLYLADSANHRVLSWSLTPPPATATSAVLVLGQPTFTNTELNGSVVASAGGTARPRALTVDGGELFSTEADYNRVLVTAAPPSVDAVASRVYGQPNPDLFLPNAGSDPSADTLSSPRGVFADSIHVAIADTANNRVLVYDRASATTTATLVLGQETFATVLSNRGGSADATTLAGPEGVYSDGARFYVADTANHRVLIWDNFPTTSGQPADHVVGQSDFGGTFPNHGGGAAANTLSSPTAVRVIGNVFLVADSGNNRVLRFAAIPAVNGANADSVLGQPDTSSRTPGSLASDPTLLAGPVQLADDGAFLYVCDRDLDRVVSYPLDGTAPNLAFSPDLVKVQGPDGLAAERTPSFTTRLYVADSNGGRVLVVNGVSRVAP